MYPKLKMAPTTANSLLLRTISLQNVKCKIASYKKFYFFVYVCVRAGERKNRQRDRDKRVCTFGQLGQYWVCGAVLHEIERQ